MKNQYIGDVNDYLKYGLLRTLQERGDMTLLVAWMLTPDDGGTDGKRRGYLDDRDKWRKHDPSLFDYLADLVASPQLPTIDQVEKARLDGGAALLPRTTFYSATVPDDLEQRRAWADGLLKTAGRVDLVFVDPDNGIEIESKRIGNKGSSKYIAWDEIRRLWDAGCSLLVYQHFCREPRETFIKRRAEELHRRTGAGFVEAFRTSHVVFLLAAQDRHVEQLKDAIAGLTERWGNHIRAVGLTGPA